MIRPMAASIQLEGDCWPTRSQTWLLRAALLPGDAGRQAWQVWWTHTGSLDGLDDGSRRLLPLLYRNLRRILSDSRATHPVLSQLKGIYRKTWYQNQALFYQIAELLDSLRAAGIATLILKGASLSVLHYHDLGARPMADFDILVPAAEAVQTIDTLAHLGWRSLLPLGDVRKLVAVKQSLDFVTTDQRRFDLHWYALWDCIYPGADDDFWAAAVPAQINHVATRALNPTDQLLHVCVHGAGFNRVPPVRWAADAMQIIHSTGTVIDWPRLLGHAERLRLSLPLRDTLYYLHTALDAAVPEAALQALASMPVTDREREFYRLKVSQRGLLGEIPLMWYHYLGLVQGRHGPATGAGFLRYLRLNWGLVHAWQIPSFLVHKTVRRLKAITNRSPLPSPG
jgi:Uncharacterised nucleotidyltransferase